MYCRCLFLFLMLCVFFFRCLGAIEVMKVPMLSQWRSQLMTSVSVCWTAPTTNTALYPSPSPSLMALWGIISLSLHCWVCLRSGASATVAASGLPNDKPGGPLDWLLSDKGPFHHSPEYIDFVEKNRQGFSTRYKIYRWAINERLRDTPHTSCHHSTSITQLANLPHLHQINSEVVLS